MKKILSILSLCIGLCLPAISQAIPPPSSEVFQLSAKRIDPNLFALTWDIKPGYFLYQKRIHITCDQPAPFTVGSIRFPTPDETTTPQGTQEPIYRDLLNLHVPILGHQGGESLLTIHYQGCSDDGFCYPPQRATVKLTMDSEHALQAVSIMSPPDITPQATELAAEQPLITAEQKAFEKSWGAVLLTFLGFGLLLSFTPCVLPMVPILSSIIVGHEKQLSTLKAFGLSLSYVLSMALTYSIMGALVALMGSNLQVVMQSPWAITLFSAVFVLLALSMFDVYELKLPTSWQSKLSKISKNPTHGHYLNAAIMGCLSILILSPCVTPPLIGALGYIAQTGNIALGSLALFFLGLGMGLPLLLVGASLGKYLPKAGRWMNTIKVLFGLLLLGMAIYLMGRILPAVFTMVLWASLLMFIGLYLGALKSSTDKSGHFKKGIGIVASVYAILVLVGAAQGNTNPLRPLCLSYDAKASTSSAPQTQTQVVTRLEEIQRVFSESHDKPILLDFYADWCTSCKIIEKNTLRTPTVQALLSQFTVLKVDLTQNDAASRTIMRHFQVVAPPTFLFFDKENHPLKQMSLIGDISEKQLVSHLEQILDSGKET